MRVRHPASRLPSPLPRLWIVTDERQGEALWTALERLPRGSGVLFRHHRTEAGLRAQLFDRVVACARRRQLFVVREETAAPTIRRVHSLRETRAARRSGAKLVFVSPIFATRTHPGQPGLGALKAARLARLAGIPSIALGGMTARRFKRMAALGFIGWAAIDGLTP